MGTAITIEVVIKFTAWLSLLAGLYMLIANRFLKAENRISNLENRVTKAEIKQEHQEKRHEELMNSLHGIQETVNEISIKLENKANRPNT